MAGKEKISSELLQITALLQDHQFTTEMAANLQRMKNELAGEPAKFRHTASTGSGGKNFGEEKIAINLAGFYAVETGIGFLIAKKSGDIIYWLNKIVTGRLEDDEKMTLEFFANATWKAGQLFRGAERISRGNFVSFYFLSEEEIRKDDVQVMAAASKLLPVLQAYSIGAQSDQLKAMEVLLKDEAFAREIAAHNESEFYSAQGLPVPPLPITETGTAVIANDIKHKELAIHATVFYALECGLTFLAMTENSLPSQTMDAIRHEKLGVYQRQLFERLGNATWKAGQPFMGLDHIKQKGFTPFDLLAKAEQHTNWVLIRKAAEIVGKKIS